MRPDYPAFLFVCGAVGSGNTFLFRSLTEDPQVYGLNEADIGGFMKRLVESEQGIARCPHALAQFLEYLQRLRADRRTLIEKSPSNIRHRTLLREYLPNARFLFTLREPRAAIVSGLKGRSILPDVEHVARLWQEDSQRMLVCDETSRVMVYEHFLANPAEALAHMAEGFLPLADEVVRFASRMARMERADPRRWKQRVSPERAAEIEYWVGTLHLDELYRQIAHGRANGEPVRGGSPQPAWRRHMRRFSTSGFGLWYRLKKPLRAEAARRRLNS